MNYDPETGNVISGADSRTTNNTKIQKGMKISMPYPGIFMSTNKEYVQTYYGDMHDHEALITFAFDPNDITSGNLTDAENEFTVPSATVINFDVINNLDESANQMNEDISDNDVRSFAKHLETQYELQDLWLSNQESRNAIELSSIIVGKENQKSGIGTSVMNDIINFADQHGKIVILDPGLRDSAHGTTSKSRLVKFYKRFGFIENKGRNKDYLFRSAMIRYPQTNESVNEVTIDNREGWGAVPNNAEIDYFGMRVMMKPSMFLKLAAKLGQKPSTEIEQHIKDHGAIGAPYLIIELPDTDDEPAQVVGHDGRNRMIAVMNVEGDDPIETHIFPRGRISRAKHLTPEIKEYLNSGIKTENTGDIVNGPLWNDGVNEAAETYTPPKLKVGDAVLIGKFKNRKAEIKGFDTDDHGQPVLKTTKGDQKLFKPRIPKLDKIDEVLNHVKRKWML